jgi:CubicO group peptidase (beta-lactamase class C family)
MASKERGPRESLAMMRWLLAISLVFLAGPAQAQETAPKLSADRIAQVDQAVQAAMEKGKIVGLAIGIIDQGEVVYLQGYGFADQDNQVSVTSKSMFRWASVSKPITAVAAMQLVDKGQLDLDADVRQLVPEFPDHGATITMRHLLSHQSGIVHYMNGKVVKTNRRYLQPNPFIDVVLALDNFKESPLIHKPGEKMSYTTHGYILASAVVERAGKQPFATQVKERINKPLGLRTLRPDYQWEQIPYRVVGYRKKGEEIVASNDADVSWKLGGGGFISNIDDMAKFASGLIKRQLVSEKAEKEMWMPQKLANGEATNYGLGFGIQNEGDQLRVSHSGGQEKTRTMLIIYPKQRRGIVLMTNCEWVNPGQVANDVWKNIKF